MKYCLFYGSLKSRGFNFNRFGGQTLVKELVLPNFELFSLGPYPSVCRGQGQVTFELHTVEDKAFEYIQRMEKGAGYNEEQINLEDGISASVFTWPKKRLENYGCKKIESGNWE